MFVLFACRVQAQISPTFLNHSTERSSGYIYGLRAGLNIARVSNHSPIAANSRLGFMAGIYADNSLGKFTGIRHELTYSRQGFRFSHPNASGKVDLQYIYITNLFVLDVGHILQVHIGPQVGYLLNAIGDTVQNLNSNTAHDFFSLNGQTNRFLFGGCAGLEVYPWKGLLLGFRYNLSFSPFNKREYNNSFYNREAARTGLYSENNAALRQEIFQITCGWRWH